MANPFKNFSLPIGKPRNSYFDLSSQTITTGEFGQLVPVKIIEAVPGDHFNMNCGVFSRCASLVVPTFGHAKITNRAFFVPSRIIFKQWNEFISNKKALLEGDVINPAVPYFTVGDLIKVLSDSVDDEQYFTTTKTIDPSFNASYNIGRDVYMNDSTSFITSTNHYIAFNFSYFGAYWIKVLTNLGYQFNWNTSIASELNVKLNAMPLLSFLKVYIDYYLPSQYSTVDTSEVSKLIEHIYQYGSAISPTQLLKLLTNCPLAYDADYFMSAWVSPNNVLGNSNIVNNNSNASYTFTGVNSTSSPFGTNQVSSTSTSNGNSTNNSLSDKLMLMIQSVSNYVTRNNYAGSRAVEQILARFGVRIPDANLNRSYYLGGSSAPLQISDVTNVAQSEDNYLGDFGGKALAYDENFNINYDVKEHGYLIILSTILPTVQYYQGRDRHISHLNQLDFYTPEFEKTIQAIASSELYSSASNISESGHLTDGNALSTNVYGYTTRYAEYKRPSSCVSGDIRLKSRGQGLDAFHLMRTLPTPDANNVIKAQGNILYYEQKGTQYNRIFNIEENDYDHFYMIYNFNIKANRPMLSMSDSIYFDHDNGESGDVKTSPNGNNFN